MFIFWVIKQCFVNILELNHTVMLLLVNSSFTFICIAWLTWLWLNSWNLEIALPSLFGNCHYRNIFWCLGKLVDYKCESSRVNIRFCCFGQHDNVKGKWHVKMLRLIFLYAACFQMLYSSFGWVSPHFFKLSQDVNYYLCSTCLELLKHILVV